MTNINKLILSVWMFMLLGSHVSAQVIPENTFEAYILLDEVLEQLHSEAHLEQEYQDARDVADPLHGTVYQDSALEDLYLRIYNDASRVVDQQTAFEMLARFGVESPQGMPGAQVFGDSTLLLSSGSVSGQVVSYLNLIEEEQKIRETNQAFIDVFLTARYANLFVDGDSANSGFDMVDDWNYLQGRLHGQDTVNQLGKWMSQYAYFGGASRIHEGMLGLRSIGSLVDPTASTVQTRKAKILASLTPQTDFVEDACVLPDGANPQAIREKPVAAFTDDFRDQVATKIATAEESRSMYEALIGSQRPVTASGVVLSDISGLTSQLERLRAARQQGGGDIIALLEEATQTVEEWFADNGCFSLDASRAASDAYAKEALARELLESEQDGYLALIDGLRAVPAVDVCSRITFVWGQVSPSREVAVQRPFSLHQNVRDLTAIAAKLAAQNNGLRQYPRAVFSFPWVNLQVDLKDIDIRVIAVPVFARTPAYTLFHTALYDNAVATLSQVLTYEDAAGQDALKDVLTQSKVDAKAQKETEERLYLLEKSLIIRHYLEARPLADTLIGQQFDTIIAYMQKIRLILDGGEPSLAGIAEQMSLLDAIP